MNAILIVLVVALIAKDTSYLGDPYIMRGVAQGLCLTAGAVWWFTHPSPRLLQRYWPVLGYLVILTSTTLVATDPFYVGMQVLSLAAIAFFFVAYFETAHGRGAPITHTLLLTTLVAYTVVATISVAMAIVQPHIAYETLYGGEVRFRGLFSKPGMMGAAAGLLCGIAWFLPGRWWVKVLPLLVGITCLLLTQSRTFWVAALVAGGVTAWRYKKVSRKMIWAAAAIMSFAASSIVLLELRVDTRALGQAVRAESLTNLTGRLSLWETGLAAVEQRPLLGFGFTAGSEGLARGRRSLRNLHVNSETSREIARETTHSGYLQALLDSGIIGFVFYLAVIVVAMYRIYVADHQRLYASDFYALTFLLIGNIAESVIYSASVYHSILFWALAIFSLSLRRRSTTAPTPVRVVPVNAQSS